MRIKTLTTFDVYNYGASLQAYALMTFLQRCGHDVELIDYQPEYLTRKYDYKWVNPESTLSRWKITRLVYRIMKYLQRQTTLKRKSAFDGFHNEYLRKTSIRFDNAASLKENPPQADIYIVGSDQVWNTFYETGRDDMFFLDFVKEGRKVSYAASFSYLDLNDQQLLRVKKLLSTFSAIGVREYQGVDLLNKIKLRSEWVIDPVFLLTNEEWKGLATPYISDSPYLLVYAFERSPEIQRFAKEYAKKWNLKIYSINDTYPCMYADKNFSNAGPLEFISLIMGCSGFVSNSFHGSAFSILFNKPFMIFTRNRHNVNSRMESLLKLFGLENRLNSKYTPDLIDKVDPINYDRVNTILKNERIKSIDFLNKSIYGG